jgi:hypothetical protein
MPPALFRRDGHRVSPGPLCTGPWDPKAMHGGPPSLLVGRYLAEHGAGTDYHLARLTVELVRPVPLETLSVTVREVRMGRRIQLLDAVVTDPSGIEVVYARGMRILREANGIDPSGVPQPGLPDVVGPEDATPYHHAYPLRSGGFYMDAFDLRSADGRSFAALGPSAAWFRLTADVFDGEPVTAIDRVIAVSDFGNGISNVVDAADHLYINPDLTINIHRPPDGEWVLNDAVTVVTSDGYGTATGTLYDRDGRVGMANQSLLVAAQPR